MGLAGWHVGWGDSDRANLWGHGFLNFILWPLTVIALLGIGASSCLMIVVSSYEKTGKPFPWDIIANLLVAMISIAVALSEFRFSKKIKRFFVHHWPALTIYHSLFWLGVVEFGLGIEVLSNLDKPRYSEENAGSTYYKIWYTFGAGNLFIGGLNAAASFIWNGPNSHVNARMVRKWGPDAEDNVSNLSDDDSSDGGSDAGGRPPGPPGMPPPGMPPPGGPPGMPPPGGPPGMPPPGGPPGMPPPGGPPGMPPPGGPPGLARPGMPMSMPGAPPPVAGPPSGATPPHNRRTSTYGSGSVASAPGMPPGVAPPAMGRGMPIPGMPPPSMPPGPPGAYGPFQPAHARMTPHAPHSHRSGSRR